MNERRKALNFRNLGVSLIGPIVLLLLVLLIFVPFTENQINSRQSDYGAHIPAAEHLADGHIDEPHFLFAALVLLVHVILPHLTSNTAALTVIVGSQIATSMIIYFCFFRPSIYGN